MKKVANVNDIAWTIFCLPASTEDTCWEVFEPTLEEKKIPPTTMTQIRALPLTFVRKTGMDGEFRTTLRHQRDYQVGYDGLY